MKRLIIKIKIVCVLIASSMLITSFTCFANSKSFSMTFVDSNDWAQIPKATKSTTSDTASVIIDTMYDSDQKVADNYKELIVRLGETGKQSAQETATKGKTCELAITDKYKAKGQMLWLNAKGNNPKLDCYVDGIFNAN